jgi:hypothetical protein
MSIFSTPEPQRPSDKHTLETRLAYTIRLLYRYLWLNLLFAALLASNLCFPTISDDLDME